MGWLAGRLLQRLIGQPADIAVAVELAPGPAFAVAVIDRYTLALERLRREFLAGDKALFLDLAFEIFRGEVGSCRREARIIIHSGYSGAGRSPARPGTR